MGLSPLLVFLQRHRILALDTSVFIYQFEGNLRYLAFTNPIFDWIEKADSRAVTSTITMTELLTQPYKMQDNKRADQFYGLLLAYPNLSWNPPSLEIADMAARFRAAYGLRTPDALQAATAHYAGATGLITNDAIFDRMTEFETLVLDRLI